MQHNEYHKNHKDYKEWKDYTRPTGLWNEWDYDKWKSFSRRLMMCQPCGVTPSSIYPEFAFLKTTISAQYVILIASLSE